MVFPLTLSVSRLKNAQLKVFGVTFENKTLTYSKTTTTKKKRLVKIALVRGIWEGRFENILYAAVLPAQTQDAKKKTALKNKTSRRIKRGFQESLSVKGRL